MVLNTLGVSNCDDVLCAISITVAFFFYFLKAGYIVLDNMMACFEHSVF